MALVVGKTFAFVCIGCGKIHLKKTLPTDNTCTVTDERGFKHDLPILNCSECPEDKVATSRNAIDRAKVDLQVFINNHPELFKSQQKRIEQ